MYVCELSRYIADFAHLVVAGVLLKTAQRKHISLTFTPPPDAMSKL